MRSAVADTVLVFVFVIGMVVLWDYVLGEPVRKDPPRHVDTSHGMELP